MSVTFAPRARMAVNASWPGVSRNVIFRPSTSAWYAPMCCVIPPASVSTTAAWRIASSSVVLPWSTWPMIVTTGGRGARSSSASSKTSGSSSSSAACLIVISRLELGPDQLDLLVGERLRDLDHLAEAHHDLDDLRGRNAERLREVADGDARRDGRGTGRRRRPRCCCAFGIASLRPRAWRGFARRCPPPSMTTRRFRPGAPWRGRIGRLGLFGSSAISVDSSGGEARERRIDDDGPPQHAVERAPSAARSKQASRRHV